MPRTVDTAVSMIGRKRELLASIAASAMLPILLKYQAVHSALHLTRDINEVRRRIAQIPDRLREIWRESEASGQSSDVVADRMAQKLIGRG